MARRSRRFEPPELPPAGGVITSIGLPATVPPVVVIRIGRRIAGRVAEQQAARLQIRAGLEWSEGLRAAVARSMMLAEAREWALHAAARRPMSRSMLVSKLRQRGLEQGPATRIAEDLAARGVIDERAFAEGVVETTLARKGAGKRFLTTRLRSRGIDSRLADQAVDRVTAASGYDARAAALELARRKLRTMPERLDRDARRRRLYGLLARRGFDAEICRGVVEELLKEP